ncbi:cobalamin B12-binding domain-containing protein [Clostridium butyricum]|uniref:cobalamin B12-binding domain-containing protein n=1 Tax=Clostridium butyricum TaxID=1492 RepID=UPI0002C93971|nr:cobalamin B12-binding domain-containing protein [Clostridium butyricum]EMU52163.1 hypothetical protein CBDKU1_39130 [Clostridium butyricum DKU-01]
MNKSVFLVVPPSDSASSIFASLGGAEHLGVQYIASYLIIKQYNSIMLNIESNYKTPEEAAEKIVSSNPLWIGISPTAFSMQWTTKFCEEIKKRSDILIVVGGHHATHLGNEFFSICKNVDIISVGDGEVTSFHISEYISGKKHWRKSKILSLTREILL